MIEIYWLTRLVSLYEFCCVFAIIGTIMLFAVGLCLPMILDADVFTYNDDENIKKRKQIKRVFRYFFIGWIIALIGSIFLPSEKDLLAIYGLGSTIEYVKSSDKAKELPDKAVDALTKYLERVGTEKNEE